MARKLTARFEVQNVIPVDSNTWDVSGNFFDEVGLYGPADVTAGMAVFLYSALDGVLRYLITDRTGVSNPITLRVMFDDQGSPVEPPANVGAICELTDIGSGSIPEEPSFQQQLLDEPLVAGIRSQSSRTQISSATRRKYFAVAGGIPQGRALFKVNSTQVGLGNNSAENTSKVIGVSSVAADEGKPVYAYEDGFIPVGILSTSSFIEGVFPAEGSILYLSSVDGKFTVTRPIDDDETPQWVTRIGEWNNGGVSLSIEQEGTVL